MLLAGEINIFVYIVFLIMTASIYLPIEGIIAFMGMIDMLDSVVGRIKRNKTMPIQEGESKFHPKNYDIEFKDVSFGYEDYSVVRECKFYGKTRRGNGAHRGHPEVERLLLQSLPQDFGILIKERSCWEERT